MTATRKAASPGRLPDERSWMPLAVLAVGLASIVLMITTDTLRDRSVLRTARLLQAMGEIQAAVAISHLWLEEYVSGDEIDVGAISDQLARARTLVDALLGAAPGSNLRLLEVPPELHNRAAVLRDSLTEFAAITEERRQGYVRGLPVGIGSALDVDYDRVFGIVLRRAHELEEALDRLLVANQRRSRLIFLAILAAWSAVIAFAAAGLWSRERHRRQAEDELRQSREQLLQSQRLEAMGQLAGGLAHDINNYLAAIRGHCELVRMKRPSGDPIGRKMSSAIRTIRKASALLDRLLAFSRRQPLELEVLNLNRIVQGLQKVMRPSLGEKIRVEVELALDLWNVEADLAQIEQVLINLMVNARDAMPDGGTITITTANQPRPGSKRDRSGSRPAASGSATDRVLLAVTDTGRGIPAELRDKIFEPFWTTKTEGKGGGLGLATVYGIVQQSGGTIEVESEVGRGTTFAIRLPRCRKPESLHERSLSSVARVGGDERILLVDDHREFRDSTRSLLETLGYEVTTAIHAEDAETVFDAAGGEFDLVLADVVMPGASGGELIESLRRRRDVAALLITGHSEEVLAHHHSDAVEVEVVTKQISATRLARKIRETLDRHGTSGSAADQAHS